MIRCKKQFIAFFMAISIVFCVGTESYIKAEALEWAIPTITAAEAIKWLLGLLGVTVAGAAIADTDYEQLVENYSNYAELKGQTAVETGKFWADIIDGTLDTGSQAWANFKEWATSLPSQISANLNSYTLDEFADSLGVVINNPHNYDISGFKFNAFISTQLQNNNLNGVFDLYDVSSLSVSSTSISFFYTKQIHLWKQSANSYRIDYIRSYDEPVNRTFVNENTSSSVVWFASFLLANITTDILVPSVAFPFGSDGIGFQKLIDSVDNIGLIVSSAISDAIPDVIPLPWDQVSDTAEGINDKINELIEKVNEGVLSLEDYMIAIQSILGVIAFDTTTDLVIPSDPDLPDETIQDKINENINNNGFVLSGLENFFPFCIPFDIYAFITILVAEPVAPVIHWEIYNPVTQENNEIVLDFAMWESIVVLMRYIFDFLFIIGLALISRSLIGGDD